MSVQKTIPYVSLRDIVVSTTDGYAIRFVANKPVMVPNFKRVIQAVQSAGCVPYEDLVSGQKAHIKTIEQVAADESTEREISIIAAIGELVERDNPIDYNRAGSPQTRSLETLTGLEKISNAERDKAWKKYQAMTRG